jgi:hypothetical protein
MKIKIIYTAIVLSVLFACAREHEKVPIAQVGPKVLYLEDIKEIIPEKQSPADSSLWVDDFVKKWIQTELLILNAEENLSAAQKDVSKELQEYRNSLLTFRYKKELMAQKMDTVILDRDIQSYYEAHKDEFILKSDVVKAIYLKIPLEVANPETIKKFCIDNDQQKLLEMDEYGLRYAKSYDRFADQWTDANEILSQVPVEIDDLERFLRRNKFIESDDTEYYYFICIRDFRIEGEYAPIEFVEQSIKNILLNQRKVNFLKKIDTDVYNEGLESRKFKIFNVKN